MLTHSQNEPFKFTINTLKRLVETNSVEKEQHHLKSCLKSITQINNLDEILNLAIDSNSFQRLAYIISKLHSLLLSQAQVEKNVKSYENLTISPTKSGQKNKETMLKHTKKIDLTPSTKKSRVLSTPTMAHLIEDLVDNLQKFDQIKHNSKRIQLLIGQVYDAFFTEDGQDSESVEDMSLDNVWKELSQLKPEQTQKVIGESLCEEKYEQLIQLLQQIQIIYKFMQVLKTTTHEIFNLIEPKSSYQTDQRSHDSYNLQALTKKSNHPSEQRSLLTEMLRDSSQKSNLQLPEHQYVSQVVLRPRFKQYSQNQTSAHLDEQFKFSYKSAKPYEKPQNKLIRSMDYYDGANNENDETVAVPIRRKEVKIKRSEMSCSRCEIF